MNIIELLQIDGISPIHASGGEYHSPCPECGGRDRFSSWPERANANGRYLGGRFVCRGCGIYGDAGAYLMKRRGMTFTQAVKELGIDPGQMPAGNHQQGRTWQPAAPGPPPPAAWQKKARAFVDHCAGQLERSSEGMEWLRTERGLSVETIRKSGMGWNNQDKWESRSGWGLPEEISRATGKPKKVWLPAGLTIPFCLEDQLHRIRIRRREPGTGEKYILAGGSDGKRAMTFWQDQRAVAVFESELDGLLVQQEAGDLCGVVSLGSAAMKPDSELHGRLMKAERVLVCLDSDEPGARAAWGHWRNYPGFKRWPAIKGKDATEQWRAGIPVKQWIEAGL
ncbi:MAG: primase-helicase zinc-binding domain-containing protein [Pseudomonadota bacterium]